MQDTTESNAAGLLEGLPAHAQAGVLAEAQVLQFLIDVRTRMDALEVGPRELARRLKVSPGQVSRWLRRETGVNARTMFLIARALGFDLRLAWTPLLRHSSNVPSHGGK
jgi:transcriptional regulator with XRE-family HTH domain